MNARLKPILSAFLLIGVSTASAETTPADVENNPLLEAILEFGLRDRSLPNEVAVVLDPPPAVELPPAEPSGDGVPDDREDEEISPADIADITDDVPADIADVMEQESPADFSSAPGPGLAIRVETIRHGQTMIDPARIALHAPFPAKPMSAPPRGWQLLSPDHVPEIIREVELAPGSSITLGVRPHVLVPLANGATIFTIPEPGFDAALGYHQTRTVGAVLADSVQNLDEDAHKLGRAIESLQQLLVSLPKPEEEASDP